MWIYLVFYDILLQTWTIDLNKELSSNFLRKEMSPPRFMSRHASSASSDVNDLSVMGSMCQLDQKQVRGFVTKTPEMVLAQRRSITT